MRLAGRRKFLVASSVLLAAPLASAQRPTVLRVGAVVFEQSSPIYTMITAPFLTRMAELGYVEGRGFIFETEPVVHGSTEAEYLRAYRELVRRKVDVFLAHGHEMALKSALAVVGTKPVVIVAVNWDPLAKGYVASLRRPGGNVTGVVFREVELTSKRFQLLREAVPDIKAATVFWDRLSADQWKEAQSAAIKAGLRIHGVEFDKPPYDFDRAFASVPPEFRGAVIPLGSPSFALPERRSLPDFALRHRVPAMYFMSAYVDVGGLASYGPNYPEMFARAADYVDRIVKGAKPEGLSIEQPTRFELVINLKTAKALGRTIPASMLLRADRVIE
jgi:putative tryptophan/tyrosine transport system substrate-binding protein